MKFYVVLATTPNRATSEKLSKGLVRNKLAACVSRVPSLTSRFWWKGKVETAKEELLIIKTAQGQLPRLIRWIKAHHPYETCEILALPVSAGNADYLNWISHSLR